MNIMSYKGYTAQIEFDGRDNIFVGRFLGLDSIVSFHGATVSGLRNEFEVAIDDFQNACKSQCIASQRSASGNVMLLSSLWDAIADTNC